VSEGVLRRPLFAGGGAGSGGERRIRAVGASARLWGWGLGESSAFARLARLVVSGWLLAFGAGMGFVMM